jgi:hypothetical protein
MSRITTTVIVALVLATIYATTVTILVARTKPPDLIEYRRLFFCRNFSSVVKDHRRDAKTHLDANLAPRDAWGDYLVRERGTIELALDVCFPGLEIAPFEIDRSDRQPPLEGYLRWLEAIELMIWRPTGAHG